MGGVCGGSESPAGHHEVAPTALARDGCGLGTNLPSPFAHRSVARASIARIASRSRGDLIVARPGWQV